MKVYVVEYSYAKQDIWCPVVGEDCLKLRRELAVILAKKLRSDFASEYKVRVRPYLRVEPAPRKPSRSGKGKRRG